MDAPTVHLIVGLPCSGKTTYAARLGGKADCVLFSLDRWLITAFGRYSIASVGHEEHTRRVLACRALIWDAACEFLRRSIDVVLDDGFFLREHRDRYAQIAAAVAARTKIHFIDTPLDVVRLRVEERNARLPPFNFWIDPETLEQFQLLFERPSASDQSETVVVRRPTANPVASA